MLGELALWRRRRGSPTVAAAVAGPCALQLAGDWEPAAALWTAIGRPYDAALALADGDADARRRALQHLHDLGAATAGGDRRPAPARARGARTATRAAAVDPRAGAPTAREVEVLAWSAEGLRNRQIAERLFLSPKTVDHHVGAILGKLDVRTAARRARRPAVGMGDANAGRQSARLWRTMIRRRCHVDRMGVEERAAWPASAGSSPRQAAGIRLAESMVELTTLEGQDAAGQGPPARGQGRVPGADHPRDPERRRRLRLSRAGPRRPRRLQGTGVDAAAVSTGFPAGQTSLAIELQETEEAVAAGAEEIDMVISREAFLSGDDARVMEETCA